MSSVGHLNGQHAHAWDFADAPLADQAFFGGQYKPDGVQVKWLAPTERFVERGLEVLSVLRSGATDRTYDDAGVTNAFSGHSNTSIADAIYKWAPNGNATQTNFKLQGDRYARQFPA